MTGQHAIPGPASDPPQTERLACAARGGDPEAFGELYARVAPALYAWASLRVRPSLRSRIEPGDVVQEVWLRAWQIFASFDSSKCPFRAWVFRVAKLVLLEVCRQQATPGRAALGPSTEMEVLRGAPDSMTAVSQRLSRDEAMRAFLERVEGLDGEERKLVAWCGVEGLGFADVARRLDLKRDAVAKRWQRLRARMAEWRVPADVFEEGEVDARTVRLERARKALLASESDSGLLEKQE